MTSKLCSNRVALPQASKLRKKASEILFVGVFLAALFCGLAPASRGADAPAWMHAAASAPLPPHDDKTDVVIIYSEDITIVESETKMKTIERRAFKILRPGGKDYGQVATEFDLSTKITGMRGWCIPAQGKDYEVKDKDAVEVSSTDFDSSQLTSDIKYRMIKIPAAEPGNFLGFEIEKEERPYILQGWWHFQFGPPVTEAKYSLQLPAGWEYKEAWINHPKIEAKSTGPNQWQWTVTDIAEIRPESEMPPVFGVAGQMIVSFIPPGSTGKKGFENWDDMGKWEVGLTQGRRDSSPELKEKVLEVTATAPTTLAKMQAIAAFMQKDIRYVGISLGIGGWQPHYARDTFSHRFGDCKDKATLMSAMLKEIGVDSYYIVINTQRGAVTSKTPPQIYWFDHVILGVRLPQDLSDPSLVAIYNHPTLGKILIFDPTDEVTPFGHLRGPLQANYSLLVTENGGELIASPQLAPSVNETHRTAKFKLSSNGTLSGNVVEVLRGDSATYQRRMLRSVSKNADRIKPIETSLSRSLGNFQVTEATVGNLEIYDKPLQYKYSFIAQEFAKTVGDLFLVRPRVLGSFSSDVLETKEPRKYPLEFRSSGLDLDNYEIELPPGYEVDDLPGPTDVEYSFATYHSKTEVKGNTLLYTRTFEIKELSVPVDKLEQLKTMYRAIASDERNTAVLKLKAN
jgi:hypothetical protein